MDSTRITILIPDMNQGGAQRVAALLANYWCAQQHAVSLITWDKAENDSMKLSSRLDRIGLDLMYESKGTIQACLQNRNRLKHLRSAISDTRPDVVISFIDVMNIMTLLATRRIPCVKIISERIDPRRHEIGRVWSWLRRWVYPHCDRLVVQTRSVATYCQRFVANEKIAIIPNAVVKCDETRVQDNVTSPHAPVIIAMGRLVPQKGFDLLIAAFSAIAERHSDWNLSICGDGPLRDQLHDQIQRLQLASRIQLIGWVADPERYLAESDIFVLSSRYEGFPNALLEAMACGLPVVSFDCESGPAEIIREGVDGFLIPVGDTDRLAKAFDQLMCDSRLRSDMGSKAAEVVTRFSTEQFYAAWDQLLSEALELQQRNRN